MSSKAEGVDAMDQKKGDNPPSYGVIKAPPSTRARSPVCLSPTAQPLEDLEAQHQPGVTGNTRDQLHWGNIDSNNWTEFVPCCLGAYWAHLLRRLFPWWTKKNWAKFTHAVFPCCIGPFPRANKVSYILFPCCTGSHKRRSDNLGICLGLLLVGILVFTLVCLVALLVYTVTKAVNKG